MKGMVITIVLFSLRSLFGQNAINWTQSECNQVMPTQQIVVLNYQTITKLLFKVELFILFFIRISSASVKSAQKKRLKLVENY